VLGRLWKRAAAVDRSVGNGTRSSWEAPDQIGYLSSLFAMKISLM
jgi:hypothetical protein